MKLPDTDDIAAVLDSCYGLAAAEVEHIAAGMGTLNYRAATQAGSVFVKQYPPDTDVGAEEAAIGLSILAGQAGVPVADIRRSLGGELISSDGGVSISLWEFVEDAAMVEALNSTQEVAAGAVLGRIHRCFAGHRRSSGSAPQTESWMGLNESRLAKRIDRLIEVIRAKGERDDFDELAVEALLERRRHVQDISRLMRELPPLTSQVVHGDYGNVNLLFRGDELAAVVDFRPPDPFLIAYEVGRVALHPPTVLLADDWLPSACGLLTAYQEEHPAIGPDDLVYSARIWLIHLMRSLYGVKEHYLEPKLLQADLDVFWIQRDASRRILYDRLAEIESAFRAVVAGACRKA